MAKEEKRCLPTECYVEIFAFLDHKFMDLVLRRVCRHFDAILSASFVPASHRVARWLLVCVDDETKFVINRPLTYVEREIHQCDSRVGEANCDKLSQPTLAKEDIERVRLPNGVWARALRTKIVKAPFHYPDALKNVITTLSGAWSDATRSAVTIHFPDEDDDTTWDIYLQILNAAPTAALGLVRFGGRSGQTQRLFEMVKLNDYERLEVRLAAGDYALGASEQFVREISKWLYTRNAYTRRITRYSIRYGSFQKLTTTQIYTYLPK